MATNFVAKFTNWPTPTSFDHLTFQNRLHDHNSDYRRLNGNDLSDCVKMW